MEARKDERPGIRSFKIPTVNFGATSVNDVIDWKSPPLMEPPSTSHLSDSEIRQNISDKSLFVTESLPNPTQGVERLIKLVTEASMSV